MQAISERALIARINRHFKGWEFVKVCREDSRWFRDLGRFYACDERNNLTKTDIDLEELGRDLGVMKNQESLAQP